MYRIFVSLNQNARLVQNDKLFGKMKKNNTNIVPSISELDTSPVVESKKSPPATVYHNNFQWVNIDKTKSQTQTRTQTNKEVIN